MKIFPLPFMYCSNLSCKFSRQTQKKLVGFSHYGHLKHMLLHLEASEKVISRLDHQIVTAVDFGRQEQHKISRCRLFNRYGQNVYMRLLLLHTLMIDFHEAAVR
jgi:extradiol dioxygenase family protein